MLKNFFNKILDFVYPTKCLICNETIIKREEQICEKCKKSLKTSNIMTCIDMGNGQKIKCFSPFEYSGEIRESILRFKFKGYKTYSKFFAEAISKGIAKKFGDVKFDCITYVPLRSERKRSRGYNQSECIASDISEIINLPCEELILKIKSNHIQHELDFSSRIENVKGVYAVKNKQAVEGKIILLCDDIITTGSTLRECAKTLFESGAKEVYCCVVASVFKQDFLNKRQ